MRPFRYMIPALLIAAMSAVPAFTDTGEDEELDERLGLKDKPFLVNLAALRSRADLREDAEVRTGLPSYDQTVERAQEIPAALIELREQRIAAREAAAAAEAAEQTTDDEPNCYYNINNELICE